MDAVTSAVAMMQQMEVPMEVSAYLLGPCFGLLGWAATGLWALDAQRLSPTEQRAMILCTWLIWMLPALGTLVQQGFLTVIGLMGICTVSTVVLTIILVREQHQWRAKQ